MISQRKQPGSSLRSDARAQLAACPGCDLRFASRRITQFYDHGLAETGLSLAQLGLMAHIAAAPDDRLAALARRTGLDQSTLSRNLRTLEGLGLVEIAAIETDLRRRMVWLTETGVRRLEAALPIWRRVGQRLAAVVSTDLAHDLARETEALAMDQARTN